MSGRSFWAQHDGLKNQLLHLPTNTDAASDPKNVHNQLEPSLINGNYCTKCPSLWNLWRPRDFKAGTANATAAADRDLSWASDPISWLDTVGTRVNKHRWCRAPNATEVLPDVMRVGLLHSRKQVPQRAATVVTQLSIDRSDMLRRQCSLWPHSITAVVYIPLLRGRMFSAEKASQWHGAPLESGMAALAALHAEADSTPGSCILTLEIVAEERCNQTQAMIYPTNALRNRALHLAATDVVLLLDADFVVDRALAATIESASEYAKLVDILSHQAAFVLPAFETADQGDRGTAIATYVVHHGKDRLTAHYIEDQVFPFYACRFPAGHRGTISHFWANTTEP